MGDEYGGDGESGSSGWDAAGDDLAYAGCSDPCPWADGACVRVAGHGGVHRCQLSETSHSWPNEQDPTQLPA
jgi:hypothetical protein